MATDHFYLKRIAVVAATVFTLGCSFYAGYLNNAQNEGNQKNFYFLVSESTHVEASAQTAILQGGAGYMLACKDGEYAAYSVYLQESDGLGAQASVKDSKLVTLTGGQLCFKSKKDKRNAAKIMGGMESLYGCIKVLESEIARLEQGATQQSSKRILQTLARQFAFLKGEYEKVFPLLSEGCEKAKNELDEICQEVIYVSDLRYLQCELCSLFVQLSSKYSL